MADVTKRHPDECPVCHGFGYTRATATEHRVDDAGKFQTVACGSGCPRCGGTGRLEVRNGNS